MAGMSALNSKALWAIGLGLAGAIGAGALVKTPSGQPLAVALVQEIRGYDGTNGQEKTALMDPSTSDKVIVKKPVKKSTDSKLKGTKITEPKLVAPKADVPKIKASEENKVIANKTATKLIAVGESNALDEKTNEKTTEKAVNDKTKKIAALEMSKTEKATDLPKITPAVADDGKSNNAKMAGDKKVETAPSIDLLRVAPDGYVVMAGRAGANQNVLAYNGDELVGKTKANQTGDYVFVFDYPLAIGEHELIVTAGKDENNMVSSLTSGVVIFPENKSDMIVLLSKIGEASKILQMPSSRFGPKTANLKDKNTPAKNTDNKVEPTAELPIAVNAVDVEEKRYYLAGVATPKSTVNVYIDNAFKGKAITGEEGAFLYYGRETITVGKHAIRVDMLGDDKITVIARAEVVLDHQTPASKALLLATQMATKKAEEKSKAEASAVKIAKLASKKHVIKKSDPVTNAAISSGSTGKKIAEIGDAPAKEMEPPKVTLSTKDASPKGVKNNTVAISKPSNVEETIDGKKIIKSGSSVIIRRGDSLWHVSRRKLGEGRKYTIIYSANRDQVKNPHRIYPGQVLNIPEQEKTSQ